MNAADRKKAKRLYDGLCSKCRPSAQSFLAKQVRKAFKPMKKARIAKQKQKRLTKKEETARIREACMKRANGACENGCFPGLVLEMDHFLGGTGRRRQKQSVETCWMLCRGCHLRKTRNEPSAAYWNDRFAAHCRRARILVVSRIEHAPLLKSSTPSVPEAGSPLPSAKGIGGVDSPQQPTKGAAQ